MKFHIRKTIVLLSENIPLFEQFCLPDGSDNGTSIVFEISFSKFLRWSSVIYLISSNFKHTINFYLSKHLFMLTDLNEAQASAEN